MPHPEPTNTSTPRSVDAVAYWDKVLDAQNLEREESAHGMDLETEIAFAQSPDFLCAAAWLEGSKMKPAFIVDLGAGLGANAFALAQRGHRVVAVDSSAARMRALMKRAREAGCADRVRCVVAVAERLPFAAASVPAVFTKSVLIHTDLPIAANELERVLIPGGRAALDEPQPGNPFVNLYRCTLAPKAWQGITRYFGSAEQQVFARAIEGKTAPAQQVQPIFFFGFFPFVFQFGWPQLGLFRLGLNVSQPLDKLLFASIRPLRRWAWFGVLTLEKHAKEAQRP